MSNSKTVSKTNNVVKYLCISAMFVAIITICSWLSFPVLEIAVTLQLFAICCAAGILGMKWGTITVVAYVALGAIGAPVFSGFRGGLAALTGVTGGYIIGFIFTAFIVGGAADLFGRKVLPLILSMILGVTVCYAFGTAWFYLLYTYRTGAIGIGTVLMKCVVPFIVPDLIKIGLAIPTTIKVYKLINKNK